MYYPRNIYRYCAGNERLRALFLLIFILFAVPMAGVETVLVGRSIPVYCSPPDVYVAGSATWNCNSSCVSLKSSGLNCEITGVKETNGSYVTVTCNYSYQTREGTDLHWVKHDGSQNFYVRVESNIVKSVSISPQSLDLDVGSTNSLSASVSPSGADYSYISWSSSNTNVVKVSGAGKSATVSAVKTGYATITATTDNGASGKCDVTVYGNNPTGISIYGASTIDAETSTQLTVSFTPELQRSSVIWTSSNPDILEIGADGIVYGLQPGMVTITAQTANGLTAYKEITVVAPKLTVTKTFPENAEQDFMVVFSPAITFDSEIFKGPGFDNIVLTEDCYSNPVVLETTAGISTSIQTWTYIELEVYPPHALKPRTYYQLTIPRDAVVNKWGGTMTSDLTLYFRTGDLIDMTLTLRQDGTKVYLDCSEQWAEIRYTTDGTQPTLEHGLVAERNQAIEITANCLLWARAFCDGFVTPEIKQEINVAGPNIVSYFPSSNENPYTYGYPYVEFDKDIFWASTSLRPYTTEYLFDNFERSYGTCWGDFYINGRYLVFVSEESMDREDYFKITIPRGTLITATGHTNEPLEVRLGGTSTYSTTLQRIDILTPEIILQPGETSIAIAKPFPVRAYFVGTWESSDPSVVRVEHSYAGVIKAVSKGKATLTVSTSAGIKATCDVYVGIQPQTYTTFPTDGATDFMVSDNISVSFESEDEAIPDSRYYSKIKLCKGSTDGTPVSVSVNVFRSGNSYRIELCPYSDLEVNTAYSVFVPKEIVKTNQGEDIIPDITFSFKTANLNVMTITTDTETTYLEEGTKLAFVCSEPDAKIYYTLDGKTKPTRNSTLYTEPITIDKDMTIWARAYKDGFIAPQFKQSYQTYSHDLNIYTSTYPYYNVYVTRDVNPYVEYMYDVQPGEAFSECFMMDYNTYEEIPGEFLTAGNRIVFVPDNPFNDKEMYYSMYVAENALISSNGKHNQEIFWGFKFLNASVALEGVKMLEEEMSIMEGTRSVVLAKPVPTYADYSLWEWNSSDEKVVTVNERGVISGVTEGQAVITLTSDNGISASCKVTVVNSVGTLFGDANNNGAVEIGDITSVLTLMANPDATGYNKKAADANKSGAIEIGDITTILTIMAGGE